MYKPISNCHKEDEIVVDVDSGRSRICKQVELGNVTANQLYCCPSPKDSGDCFPINNNELLPDNCPQNKRLAHCHNLTNFDACRRTDLAANRVCGWQDGLFCLTVNGGIPTGSYYNLFPEAAKLMLNRNEKESYNGTKFYYDNVSQTYQLCDSSACD